MAISKQSSFTNRVRALLGLFELNRTFLIFSVIYLPVFVLFFDHGFLAEILLGIYTLLLALAGGYMIIRFLLYLADAGNKHKGNYGSVFMMYLLNVLMPLVVFKVVAYVFWSLLPQSVEQGFWCDVVYFIGDMYRLFQVQQVLNLLILGSLSLMLVFTLWSVRKE